MTLRPWFVRLFRLAVVALALALVHHSPARRALPVVSVTLADAQLLFPTASRMRRGDPALGLVDVFAVTGTFLGSLVRTSPSTDDLVGYTGPNDLLVALDPSQRIVAVTLMASADTDAHVIDVLRATRFWSGFERWSPHQGQPLAIDAVAGSTLTSMAMTEAVERRLAGGGRSHRFPDGIALEEVVPLFRGAAHLGAAQLGNETLPVTDVSKPWIAVTDGDGDVLGYVLRTSPVADNIRGYRGPTDVLVAVDASRQAVVAVRLRDSFDTPEHVDRIRDDDFLSRLTGPTVSEWGSLDFERAGIEGVSGATQTSFAVADGIRQRLRQLESSDGESTATWITGRSLGLLAILIGATVMTFGRWSGRRRVRRAWQVVIVVALGLVLGDLISIALLAGWARHGVPIAGAPVVIGLVAVALLIPWGSGRQLYCHSVCPHGAVQEWLGSFRRLRVRISPRVRSLLRKLPGVLLATAFLIAFFAPRFELSTLEPFDAWSLGALAFVSAVIAGVGLFASIFEPMAYCRFACPTGALFGFLRTRGANDRFGRRDAVALLLLIVAGSYYAHSPGALSTGGSSSEPHTQRATQGVTAADFRGQAFGTSWSVDLRGEPSASDGLQDTLADELERIEAEFSSWRADSEVTHFNESRTTLPLELSDELLALVDHALSLSRKSDGAFDITIGPLLDAWGAGPSGKRSTPADDEIARLLAFTGWHRLTLDRDGKTLRKDHPDVRIDLGSLLQGYAADRLAEFIDLGGPQEYLIEVGGEMRARGRWRVAIESPAPIDRVAPGEPIRTVTINDEALATSGSYRNDQHLISATSGRPVVSPVKLCCVRASTALEADGWATALIVSGARAESLAVANRVAALLVTDRDTVEIPPNAFEEGPRPSK